MGARHSTRGAGGGVRHGGRRGACVPKQSEHWWCVLDTFIHTGSVHPHWWYHSFMLTVPDLLARDPPTLSVGLAHRSRHRTRQPGSNPSLVATHALPLSQKPLTAAPLAPKFLERSPDAPEGSCAAQHNLFDTGTVFTRRGPTHHTVQDRLELRNFDQCGPWGDP